MQQSQQPQTSDLQDLLTRGDHQNAIKITANLIDQSPLLRLVHACLQIKNEDSKGALTTLQYKGITPELQPLYDQTRMYANYKQGNYDVVTTELIPQKKLLSVDQRFILAQALCRAEKWNDAADQYTELLTITTIQDDHQDILTNLINVAITSQDLSLQQKVIKVAQEYTKKKKGQVSKELLLNQALLHLASDDLPTTRELINRLINLIKLDTQMDQELESDEDFLVAQIVLDYLDINQSKDETKLQDKIRFYESLVAKPNIPKSVLPVCLNNLSCLQERFFHNHHDTLKRIEDAITLLEDKSAPQQLTQLKVNKTLVQFSRNRLNEAIKSFKEIEPLTQPYIASLIRLFHNLKTNIAFDVIQPLMEVLKLTKSEENQIFAFLLVAAQYSDLPNKILQVFEQTLVVCLPKWTNYTPLVLFILATSFKATVKSDNLLTQIEQAGFLPDLCQYYLKNNELDRALKIYDTLEKQKHPKVEEIRGRVAIKFIDQNEWKKAERFLNEVPYPFKVIDDFGELEMLETNIQLTKTQRDKSQDLTELVQKSIKKKKKRSRRPKNLPADAPLPNPERWLPKYERKEYRKRKGAQMKSRTQGSSTGVGNKETMNVFTQGGASSANVDVSKKSKNRKRNK